MCEGKKKMCVKWSIPTLIVFTLLCVSMQIVLFNIVSGSLQKLNPATNMYFLIVSPYEEEPGDLPIPHLKKIRPCVLPSLGASGLLRHECPIVPGQYCPSNYSCLKSGSSREVFCQADDFSCGDSDVCLDIVKKLPVLDPDYGRFLSCDFPKTAFYVSVGLQGAAILCIICALLVNKMCSQKMHKPVCLFPTILCFSLVTIVLVVVSLSQFLSSFSPGYNNQAEVEAANCFQNNAGNWFLYMVSMTILSVTLMCVTVLSVEIIAMGTIAYYIPGIHQLFWNCNTFVILAVLISMSFGVSCFIIFANALNEY